MVAGQGERGQEQDSALEPVLDAIHEQVSEHVETWFPDRRPGAVSLHILSNRPRCVLVTVHLDEDPTPVALAKIRRDSTTPQAGDEPTAATSRPRLRFDVVPATEMTRLEYDGLREIAGMFPADDPGFAAIRPLAHLQADATIVMGYVQAPTLRRLVLAESRLHAWRRRGDTGPWTDAAYGCRLAGGWLRKYQQAMPRDSLPVRQGRREDVVAQFGAYDDFLSSALRRRWSGDLARAGAELARSVLPETLPGVVGHGDFAPRNMFVDHGRLVVFDPMPRWVVPAYEDVCRFVVGLRLLGQQVHSHGLAYATTAMDRYERETLEGFLGGPDGGDGSAVGVTEAAVRCYQLLILLDKWSALLDTPGQGLGTRAVSTSVRLASGFIEAEGRRVLALAEHAAR